MNTTMSEKHRNRGLRVTDEWIGSLCATQLLANEDGGNENMKSTKREGIAEKGAEAEPPDDA